MTSFGEKNTRAAYYILLVVGLTLVASVALKYPSYQWDLKTSYYAARVDMQGQDPYDRELLSQAAGAENINPYLYPPATLWLFGVLASFSYPTAYFLWLGLKLALLVLLILIWRRCFLQDETGWLVYLFLITAFGGAVYLDFKAGNISVLEQTLIWSGFYFLKEKRPGLFCVMILAASVFKGAPLIFLLLLPILRMERRWLYLAGAGVGSIVIFIVNYFPDPARFERFVTAVLAVDERGQSYNASILALIKDCFDFTTRFGFSESWLPILAYVAYFVVIGVVLAVTIHSFRVGRDTGSRVEVIHAIYATCLVYALIMPRFKVYSFILLIPVAFYIIRHCYTRGSFALQFILVSLSAHPPAPFQTFLEGLWWYYPLFVAYGLWLVWLLVIRRGEPDSRFSSPTALE